MVTKTNSKMIYISLIFTRFQPAVQEQKKRKQEEKEKERKGLLLGNTYLSFCGLIVIVHKLFFFILIYFFLLFGHLDILAI
jgi:hypothetical protein